MWSATKPRGGAWLFKNLRDGFTHRQKYWNVPHMTLNGIQRKCRIWAKISQFKLFNTMMIGQIVSKPLHKEKLLKLKLKGFLLTFLTRFTLLLSSCPPARNHGWLWADQIKSCSSLWRVSSSSGPRLSVRKVSQPVGMKPYCTSTFHQHLNLSAELGFLAQTHFLSLLWPRRRYRDRFCNDNPIQVFFFSEWYMFSQGLLKYISIRLRDLDLTWTQHSVPKSEQFTWGSLLFSGETREKHQMMIIYQIQSDGCVLLRRWRFFFFVLLFNLVSLCLLMRLLVLFFFIHSLDILQHYRGINWKQVFSCFKSALLWWLFYTKAATVRLRLREDHVFWQTVVKGNKVRN